MSNKIKEYFMKHDDDYLAFEKIEDKRHSRPDVCAMLYLHEKLGGEGDAVTAAEHDEIFLEWEEEDVKKLNEEDVLYITRCGVRYDSDTECLAMFV